MFVRVRYLFFCRSECKGFFFYLCDDTICGLCRRYITKFRTDMLLALPLLYYHRDIYFCCLDGLRLSCCCCCYCHTRSITEHSSHRFRPWIVYRLRLTLFFFCVLQSVRRRCVGTRGKCFYLNKHFRLYWFVSKKKNFQIVACWHPLVAAIYFFFVLQWLRRKQERHALDVFTWR